VTRLTHPATGHSLVAADKASVDFWTAAGYAPEKGAKSAPAKKPAKKAAAKKSAAKKSK
jgi:topoisomerase IA-like protein